MSSRRCLRVLATSSLTLVLACELALGIRDRPLAEDRGDAAALDDAASQGRGEASADSSMVAVDAAGDGSARDSSDEAAKDAQGEDAGPCAPFSPPPRPTVEDGSLDLVLQLALRSIDLGIRLDLDAAGPPLPAGYNLDGLQTCPDVPCLSRTPTLSSCNGACGVDNAATPLFQTFAQQTNGRFNQQAFNDQLALGSFGLIFRIRRYNGGANDAHVEVGLFDSNGTTAGDGGGTGHVPPRWDGSDLWTLDSHDVLAESGPSANPAYIQIDAYVANHVLVAQIDRPIRLYGGAVLGTLVFQTAGSVFTGTLTPSGGAFRIDDGTVAGRWPTKYVASGLEAVPDPIVDGGYLCASSSTSSYSIIAKIICSGADLTTDPRLQSASSMCDAVSFGIGFTASPALMGPVTTRPAPPTTCPDAGIESCNY